MAGTPCSYQLSQQWQLVYRSLPTFRSGANYWSNAASSISFFMNPVWWKMVMEILDQAIAVQCGPWENATKSRARNCGKLRWSPSSVPLVRASHGLRARPDPCLLLSGHRPSSRAREYGGPEDSLPITNSVQSSQFLDWSNAARKGYCWSAEDNKARLAQLAGTWHQTTPLACRARNH